MESILLWLLISSRSVNKHGHHRQFLFLIGWFLLWNRFAKWTETIKMWKVNGRQTTYDGRRTPNYGKRSHCLWQGELQMCASQRISKHKLYSLWFDPKLCATFSANVYINYRLPIKVYYHICTLRHIRIEINHVIMANLMISLITS
jgi:hypothetical protein